MQKVSGFEVFCLNQRHTGLLHKIFLNENSKKLWYGPRNGELISIDFEERKEIYSSSEIPDWELDIEKLSDWINVNYKVLEKLSSRKNFDLVDFIKEYKRIHNLP